MGSLAERLAAEKARLAEEAAQREQARQRAEEERAAAEQQAVTQAQEQELGGLRAHIGRLTADNARIQDLQAALAGLADMRKRAAAEIRSARGNVDAMFKADENRAALESLGIKGRRDIMKQMPDADEAIAIEQTKSEAGAVRERTRELLAQVAEVVPGFEFGKATKADIERAQEALERQTVENTQNALELEKQTPEWQEKAQGLLKAKVGELLMAAKGNSRTLERVSGPRPSVLEEEISEFGRTQVKDVVLGEARVLVDAEVDKAKEQDGFDKVEADFERLKRWDTEVDEAMKAWRRLREKREQLVRHFTDVIETDPEAKDKIGGYGIREVYREMSSARIAELVVEGVVEAFRASGEYRNIKRVVEEGSLKRVVNFENPSPLRQQDRPRRTPRVDGSIELDYYDKAGEPIDSQLVDPKNLRDVIEQYGAVYDREMQCQTVDEFLEPDFDTGRGRRVRKSDISIGKAKKHWYIQPETVNFMRMHQVNTFEALSRAVTERGDAYRREGDRIYEVFASTVDLQWAIEEEGAHRLQHGEVIERVEAFDAAQTRALTAKRLLPRARLDFAQIVNLPVEVTKGGAVWMEENQRKLTEAERVVTSLEGDKTWRSDAKGQLDRDIDDLAAHKKLERPKVFGRRDFDEERARLEKLVDQRKKELREAKETVEQLKAIKNLHTLQETIVDPVLAQRVQGRRLTLQQLLDEAYTFWSEVEATTLPEDDRAIHTEHNRLQQVSAAATTRSNESTRVRSMAYGMFGGAQRPTYKR